MEINTEHNVQNEKCRLKTLTPWTKPLLKKTEAVQPAKRYSMLQEPRCFCATDTPVPILSQMKSVHLVPQYLRPSLMLIYQRKKEKCYTHVFTCTLRFWSVMCTTSLHLSSATYIACAAANCSRGWTSLTYS